MKPFLPYLPGLNGYKSEIPPEVWKTTSRRFMLEAYGYLYPSSNNYRQFSNRTSEIDRWIRHNPYRISDPLKTGLISETVAMISLIRIVGIKKVQPYKLSSRSPADLKFSPSYGGCEVPLEVKSAYQNNILPISRHNLDIIAEQIGQNFSYEQFQGLITYSVQHRLPAPYLILVNPDDTLDQVTGDLYDASYRIGFI